MFDLGLSAWQAVLAGLLGYALSSTLVGILAVGGPRTGLPTLTQTRFAFGFHGNKFPTFFAYLSNVGWQVTIITLASTSGAKLFARLWPGAFADGRGEATVPAIVAWFVVVLAVTVTVAVFGHQMIMKVEKWIAWLTGVMTSGRDAARSRCAARRGRSALGSSATRATNIRRSAPSSVIRWPGRMAGAVVWSSNTSPAPRPVRISPRALRTDVGSIAGPDHQTIRHHLFGARQLLMHAFWLTDGHEGDELFTNPRFDFAPGVNFEPWFAHHRAFAEESGRLSEFLDGTRPLSEVAVLYPLRTSWARAPATPTVRLRRSGPSIWPAAGMTSTWSTNGICATDASRTGTGR